MRRVYQGTYQSEKLHRGFLLNHCLGEIILESRLIISTGGFILFELNTRYSVLSGLTDNLFDVIHENTTLILDSIAERANEVSSGENDK